MSKKLFLIIGAPGSGKTTDASIIAKECGYTHYSTGDLLRAEVASGSELGRQIEGIISAGNLVPLDVVVSTILSAISKAASDVILIDGYPRSSEQMHALDNKLAAAADIELAGVIEVYVSEQVARDRVLGRARGADDNEEVFANRMKVYSEPLEQILSFYKAKNLHIQINGERSIEEITAEMSAKIKNLI